MHSPSIATGTGFARLELALRAGSAEAPPVRTAAALALPTAMLASAMAVLISIRLGGGPDVAAGTTGAASGSPLASVDAGEPTGMDCSACSFEGVPASSSA
eukprot:jgi/Chrpa1/4077/Chrysochromulina_OHIO_Genome00012410-RA